MRRLKKEREKFVISKLGTETFTTSAVPSKSLELFNIPETNGGEEI